MGYRMGKRIQLGVLMGVRQETTNIDNPTKNLHKG